MNREQKIKKIFNGYYNNIIDMEVWKSNKRKLNDSMAFNISGNFYVVEINKEGYFVLKQSESYYKVLLPRRFQDCLKVGDQIKCNLYKKIFFMYWEIYKVEQLKLVK